MLFSRKKIVAAAVATVTLGMGVAAFAYFTADGSGTGSANVGSASAIELHATTTGVLYPGGPARDVAITVTNPGAANQYVDAVHLASVETPAGCDASAFTMGDVAVAQNLAANASTTVHGALTMADAGNQDACQDGSLVLHLTSN
jgi:hypothetical protein